MGNALQLERDNREIWADRISLSDVTLTPILDTIANLLGPVKRAYCRNNHVVLFSCCIPPVKNLEMRVELVLLVLG